MAQSNTMNKNNNNNFACHHLTFVIFINNYQVYWHIAQVFWSRTTTLFHLVSYIFSDKSTLNRKWYKIIWIFFDNHFSLLNTKQLLNYFLTLAHEINFFILLHSLLPIIIFILRHWKSIDRVSMYHLSITVYVLLLHSFFVIDIVIY